MKEKKGRDLTIEEMFAVFIGEVDPAIAEKHFNFFRKAFEESELGGENFDWDALYSKYFDNMKRFAINDISKLISNTTKVPAKPVTPAEVNKQDAETNSNIQEDATPVAHLTNPFLGFSGASVNFIAFCSNEYNNYFI